MLDRYPNEVSDGNYPLPPVPTTSRRNPGDRARLPAVLHRGAAAPRRPPPRRPDRQRHHRPGLEPGPARTAEATVTLTPRSPACRTLLNNAVPWAHELSIWRDDTQVWEGPLYDLDDTGDTVTLTGRDVTAWLTKRIVHTGYDTEGETVDVATLAANMLRDAYGPDDPDVLPYLWVVPAGVAVERYVEAETVMADADLADLAGLGLDWTVIGRRIVLFGAEPLTRLPALRGEHFAAPLPIAEAGAAVTTRAVVQGGGVRGEAGGVHPVLGLLEDLVTATDLDSDEAAAVRAAAVLYTPTLLINASVPLTSRAPVTIDQLVPGVAASVSGRGAALRVQDADMQLVKLSVGWSPQGETVTPTFVELTDRTAMVPA